MNRIVSHAQHTLLVTALLAPSLSARAEAPKQAPSAQQTAESAPASNAAPAAAPIKVEAREQENEAPATLIQIPSPLAQKADAAAQGDTSDATPDNDLTEAIPGDPWGDAQGLSAIALRSLFQLTYTSTFAERSTSSRASYRVREDNLAQKNDGYEINRLFMRMSTDPVKYVGFKAVLDFAELISGDPEDLVKQAYSTISPMPGRIEIIAGLFKVPFSTPELDPSARYEFVRLGPANQLMNDLGFTGRDYGVELIGAPLPKAKRLHLMLGIFRGHAYDEHDSPAGSIAGRIEAKPNKAWRIGGGVISHLRSYTYNRPFETSDKDTLPDPPDPLYPAQKRWGRGSAYGVDARFKKKGFMLRGEGVYGDRVDIDKRYGAKHFWNAWAIAAYSVNLGDVKLLPALRGEWLDADVGKGKGGMLTLSGGITVIAYSRARFLVDVTHTRVQHNTPVLNQPKPLQLDPYLALTHTTLTCQLQLEL